jgi:hypothetical protein
VGRLHGMEQPPEDNKQNVTHLYYQHRTHVMLISFIYLSQKSYHVDSSTTTGINGHVCTGFF